jgi:hypothetical protein
MTLFPEVYTLTFVVRVDRVVQAQVTFGGYDDLNFHQISHSYIREPT